MMDKEKHAKPPSDILSPSKITDYFTSKTDLVQDIGSCDKHSSVYLTPKSSPVKDNEENQVAEDLSQSDVKQGSVQCESISSLAISNHGRDCEPSTETDPSEANTDSSEKVDKMHGRRTSSRLNRCAQDHVLSPDSSKRKSNQHRICQVTRSSIVNPEDDTSIHPSSVESVTISSPSLPQRKIRKNSKPKTVQTNGQPNGVMQSNGAKSKSGRGKKAEPIQNTAITDYFPIRRSGRQTKSQIEKETQVHVEKLIKSNYEGGLAVKDFEGKGRGIVATKMFDKGDYVVEYAGDLLDMDTARDRETEYALTPSIGCYMYFFNHKNKQYCVDATMESGRLGRLINHSRNGNCGTKVVMVDDQPRLILVAARYIREGEELSYDYGDRSKEALEAHPWLKL